eukprot:14478323-Heterocapsa_arctica.AAC.1
MKKHDISILCLQDTRIPQSCVEDKQGYTFLFSSSSTSNGEFHGVGFCYKRSMGKHRNYDQHIDNNMMEIEINMHGNPLVIMTAYMPHDGVNEDKRLPNWENLYNRITAIPPSKKPIILGDFNAQLHTRKEGEEPNIGPHIVGKGLAFLLAKENTQGDKMFNRSSLTDLLREHDLRVMNTFLHKPPREKATCKSVGKVGDTGPWTTDRYSEIDFCLARTRWHNSIID